MNENEPKDVNDQVGRKSLPKCLNPRPVRIDKLRRPRGVVGGHKNQKRLCTRSGCFVLRLDPALAGLGVTGTIAMAHQEQDSV